MIDAERERENEYMYLFAIHVQLENFVLRTLGVIFTQFLLD